MAGTSEGQRRSVTPLTSSSSPSAGRITTWAPSRLASRTLLVNPDTDRNSPASPNSPMATRVGGTANPSVAEAIANANATSTPGSLADRPPAVAANTSNALVSTPQRDSSTASSNESRCEDTWYATRRVDPDECATSV